MIRKPTLALTAPLLLGWATCALGDRPRTPIPEDQPTPAALAAAKAAAAKAAAQRASAPTPAASDRVQTAPGSPAAPGPSAAPEGPLEGPEEAPAEAPLNPLPNDPAYNAGVAVLTKAERNDYDLLSAAAVGQTWKVRELLARGARLEARDVGQGFTPLMWAAAGGYVGTVRYLLEKGAQVNTRSRTGVSILLATSPQATSRTDAATTALMSDPTYLAARQGGVTPLILAAAHGYGVTLRELLQHGADPNQASPEGLTALTCACFKGSLSSVQALLARGANVNAGDIYNGYPLMMAAVQGNADVIRALLAKGARATLGSNGWTPAAIAKAYGHTAAYRLLLRVTPKSDLPATETHPQRQQQTLTADPNAAENGIILIR